MDRIVYDRYVCCAFGVLCMVALYVLVWKRDLFGIKAKLLSVAGCGVTLVLFARITAPYLNNQSFVRKYMGMLVTFVKTNAKSVTFKGDHVSSGVILFGVVALILFLLILFLCQKKKGYQACALTLLVSVLLFGYNVTNITISESNTREARISSASNLILSFGDIYKEYLFQGIYLPVFVTPEQETILTGHQKPILLLDRKNSGTDQIVSGASDGLSSDQQKLSGF